MEKRIVLICCFVQLLLVYGDQDFDFRYDDKGSYSLYINGKLWLQNGPLFFNGYGKTWSTDSTESPLVLKSVTELSGGDVNEKWKETQFTYTLGNTKTSVIAAIRIYTASIYTTTKVLFSQIYPTGASDTSKGIIALEETVSGFPCVKVQDPQEKLGYLSYGGSMFGNMEKQMSTFGSTTVDINDGIKGGPLALFNEAGKAAVISPYNNFMAASVWHQGKQGGKLAWGIMGGVNDIPANSTYSTLLVFHDGINQAFQSWGQQLMNQFGKSHTAQRLSNISSDLSLNYLGYWTDNGAYYYYHTETKENYEDTLLDVKQYAVDNQIPYKYLQLDSWWYPKDVVKAVLTWTPMANIFPNGIKYLSDKTGWPIAAHNRYWSKETPYAKERGGNFTFIIELLGSLPDDQSFWDYLLSQAKGWGLFLYEQDWLYVQTLYMKALVTNLTLGHDWLLQMSTAAAKNQQTIQYCMSYPRHALQSLEFPDVTQARVSEDYLAGKHQWKVGISSMFARALRIQPYKDTFWTTSVQPGNPYNKTEPYPELEAAVASLTAGPVGPSDKINSTNIPLLMRCCTMDGNLLKPSRPATAIDKQIILESFKTEGSPSVGEVWSTQSFIKVKYYSTDVVMEYGILFAADVTVQFTVGLADLGFQELSKGLYFPYNNPSQWKEFDSSLKIDLSGCSKENFCLYYFSPYINSSTTPVLVNLAILGEIDKWVPMSANRIDHISITSDPTNMTKSEVDLYFNTAPSTELLDILYVLDGELKSKTCSTGPNPGMVCQLY